MCAYRESIDKFKQNNIASSVSHFHLHRSVSSCLISSAGLDPAVPILVPLGMNERKKEAKNHRLNSKNIQIINIYNL
jgi:hypothetical protein